MLMNARFLPGQIVVPSFVIDELHRVADSADPEKRRSLMPIERRWPIGELLAAAGDPPAPAGGEPA